MILHDTNSMLIVEKIAREFELERLKSLLDLDMKRSKGNKRLLAQKKIEHLNNFGKDYTRLEIAAARIDKGPKKDEQIWDYIAFLNEKNILDTWVTPLNVIENPIYYLKLSFEQLLQRKDNNLERKRKLEGTCQEKSDKERKRTRRLEVERKSEKLQGKFAVQKRQQERVAETKRRQEVERERARKAKDLRSQHSNTEKITTNASFKKRDMDKEVGRERAHKPKTCKSEVLKSTSLKKRAFDERSDAPPSFRASKRRNVGNRELDICEMRTKNMHSALEKLKRKKKLKVMQKSKFLSF